MQLLVLLSQHLHVVLEEVNILSHSYDLLFVLIYSLGMLQAIFLKLRFQGFAVSLLSSCLVLALKVRGRQGENQLVEFCFEFFIPYLSLHLFPLSHIQFRVIKQILHVINGILDAS